MPGDTRSHLARLAKKKRSAPGNIADLLERQWRAVEAAEAVLLDACTAEDATLVLKGVHALTQASGAYAKLIEVGELEARLADLEARLDPTAPSVSGDGAAGSLPFPS